MRQFLTLIMLSATLPALGQEPTAAPAPAPVPRLRPWYQPRHLVLQTGGGVGLVAGGVGYTFLRDRFTADILVGYVPKKYAGSTLTPATGKLLYWPYTVPLGKKWQLRPLAVGLYMSYAHGIINDGKPNQYPDGYYWFSTTTRVGPLLGGQLTYRHSVAARPDRQRRLSAYYELGTNDLYLVSYFSSSRGLSPVDILTLSLGLKVDL